MIRTQAWRDQRERRYHLEVAALPELCQLLSEELPVVSYVAGSTRSLVVTTYLDSVGVDYSILAERSASHRSIKVRVREYMALFAEPGGARLEVAPTCYLERKERRGQMRVKQRVELAKAELAAVLRRELPLPGDDAVGELRAELERRALEPVLVSAYRRRVFGADGGLRVTVDEEIEFFRPLVDLYQEASALTPVLLGEPTGRVPGCILEVKEPHASVTPDWIESLLAGLAPVDQFSKFRHGMTCLAEAAAELRPARATAD